MKRTEEIIIDVKVKSYDVIRLKQLDSTELIFKILDNGQAIDLTKKTASIIFAKPNKSIVIQDCIVDTEDNTVKVVLMTDCVRKYGAAKIEVEIKEDTEIVSSFCLDAFIEPSSKENVRSDNTDTYIESLEKLIAKLQENANNLIKNIQDKADTQYTDIESRYTQLQNQANKLMDKLSSDVQDKINDIEQRYSTLTEDIQNLLNNYNSLIEEIKNIDNHIGEKVDMHMKDYLLRKTDIKTSVIPSKTTIKDQYEVRLPVKYIVGNNSLEMRADTEVMKLASDTEDGHYKEVGEAGELSNKIKMHRTEQDGNWELEEDLTLTSIARGIPTKQVNAEGEYITLDNCSGLEFDKFIMQGNSEQETSEQGNNLLDISKVPDTSNIVKISDGIKITDYACYFALTKFPVKFKAGHTYYCKSTFNIVNEGNATGVATGNITIRKDDAHIYTINKNPFTVPDDFNENEYSIFFYGANGGECTFTDIIISEKDVPYEPFVPDKPSLEYLSDIRNCGSESINQIDLSNIIEYKNCTATAENKILKVKNTNTSNPAIIISCNLPAGNYYVFIKRIFSDFNITFYDKDNHAIGNNIFSSGPITLSNDATTMRINSGLSEGDYELPFSYLYVNKGSQDLGYDVYNSNKCSFVVSNRNIANTDVLYSEMYNHNASVVRKEIIDSKNCIVFHNSYFRGEPDVSNVFRSYLGRFKENTRYKLTATARINDTSIVSAHSLSIMLIYKDGTYDRAYFSASGTSWQTKSFITQQNKTVEYMGFTYGEGAWWCLDEDSFIIEEYTEEDKPYIKNEEQTIVFPTKEGQVLRKGDYIASDEVHQLRETIEFDGTEDWNNQNGGFDTENRIFFALRIDSINANVSKRKGLCNYFINANNVSVQSTSVDITAFNFNSSEVASNWIYFKIEKDKLPTPDILGWKQWLAERKAEGKPLKVEYDIKEKIEPFSQEQQEAYNEIVNATTYKGLTNIFSTDDVRPYFEVEHTILANERSE